MDLGLVNVGSAGNVRKTIVKDGFDYWNNSLLDSLTENIKSMRGRVVNINKKVLKQDRGTPINGKYRIEGCYPKVFVVKSVQSGLQTSFMYTDVLTNTVKIDGINAGVK